MARKHRFESTSLQYLYDKHIADQPKLQAVYEEELVNVTLARQLYELRKHANLAQAELARLANTTASVISRLEDPNYRGHSLSIITRIANILGKRVKVSFLPKRQSLKQVATRKKLSRGSKREHAPSSH